MTETIMLIIFLTMAIEWCMGRKICCKSAFAGNSKGLIDFYTLSHIIHGFLFYWLFSAFFSFATTLILSVATECCWEVLENSPFAINRYRRTSAANYQGDVIMNSVSDVLVMIGGVIAASILCTWATLATILIFELVALFFIRDNLCLNVIMLIYPFESIKKWQTANDRDTTRND